MESFTLEQCPKPEELRLGQQILVKPINSLSNRFIKVKILGLEYDYNDICIISYKKDDMDYWVPINRVKLIKTNEQIH